MLRKENSTEQVGSGIAQRQAPLCPWLQTRPDLELEVAPSRSPPLAPPRSVTQTPGSQRLL